MPELTGLGGGGLVLRVEGGRAGQDGLAPADDDVLPVALGDDDGVGGVRHDGFEPQPAGTTTAERRGGRGEALGGRGGGAQRGPAAEGAGDDVADVLVGAGVGNLVEAGVTTPETNRSWRSGRPDAHFALQ